MQALKEHTPLQSSPSINSDPQNQLPQIATKVVGEDEIGEIEHDYGDFTFSSFDGVTSPISADVVFQNGQIKPNYPLFDDGSVKKTRDGLSVLEEEAVGPYCAWKGKAVEDCNKKSNSTGFSRMWRFRDRVNRSSSDGKDAFVYLKREEEKKSKGGSGEKLRTAASAHEMHYVKKRAMREEDRRRSYLPYRPEVFGFFTSVQGGFTKNVHPF